AVAAGIGLVAAGVICALLAGGRRLGLRVVALVLAVTGLAMVGTSLGRHAALPGGPAANSVTGMAFGIAGSACMVFAGLLAGLRRVPSWWWIGSRQWWLKGHIWLGLLSGVLILFHSTFRLGGPLEAALWVVLILVIASGVFGLALQHVLPH